MSLQLDEFALEAEPGQLREAELLFALSRRHALPFSVVALLLKELPEAGSQSRLTSEVGTKEVRADRIERLIAPILRGTDVLVHCGESGHYMTFCPGTDVKGAAEFARRLRDHVHDVDVVTGIASFGEDALTLEDLIGQAWSKLFSDNEISSGEDGPTGRGNLRLVSHGHGRSAASGWQRRWARRIKRIFDLAFVVVTAPFWLLTFVTVALAVKLTDFSAPVFFVQLRTGQGGKRFKMYKFRTMVPDAERLKEQLRDQNELHWPDFKMTRDPRITVLGRILRKTSLDELPQLVNVLRGDMSLVGPRPTSFEAGTYEPWQTARLEVPPGLTGLWQVEGRAATRFDERIRIELDYIDRQSFLLDLWILLRTVPAVIQMRGGH